MKIHIKKTLQFLSFYWIFILCFMLPGMIIPRSEKMSKILVISEEEMQYFFPLLLLFGLYMTITYWLLVKNVNEKKTVLMVKLLAANIILFPLMGFLESIFWRDAFQEFTTLEIMSIFLPFLITYILFTFYITIISRNDPDQVGSSPFNSLSLNQVVQKIVFVAFIYFIIYNLAGYFIAWQFEETRVFYSGNNHLDSFFVSFGKNISDIKFVTVHLFRGGLFAIAGLIIYNLLKTSQLKKILVMSLLFGGFGFQIILPNPLFPATVRVSHFIETTVSMLTFGAIMAIVFHYRQLNEVKTVVA